MLDREVIKMNDLESRVTQLEIRVAVAESNIDEVKSKLNKIDNNINKLLWLVGGAIVLAILKSTFGGGLF
jgi:archaellum component FlaC